ncbi:unnamed protein product [Polarella glacialis]|uniref:Uncharacterized protein n=1 Tax=Polarella glacialis TaxID=89957 RepID=A0A813F0N6_POLGL|nr:unnamed protein product [Polarella glacialis]CAE8637022.1 unnamed protein product [Polarella glacialis]
MMESKDPAPHGLGCKVLAAETPPLVLSKKNRSDAQHESKKEKELRRSSSEGGARRRRPRQDLTEEQKISALRKLNAFASRNFVGGVCEGVTTTHNITHDYKLFQ